MDLLDLKFVQYITEQLVEDPEAIVIERKNEDRGVHLIVSVSKIEMGRIIGKEGKMAESIRSLLKVIESKLGYRIRMTIQENIEN